MNDFSRVASTPTSMPPIHARNVWTEPALCPSQYATVHVYVTCRPCRAEIERRLEARKARR